MEGLQTVTISLPPEMVREMEILRKAEGKTPSEFLREALRLYIRRKKWEMVREYGARRASELGIREEDIEKLIDDYRSEEGSRTDV